MLPIKVILPISMEFGVAIAQVCITLSSEIHKNFLLKYVNFFLLLKFFCIMCFSELNYPHKTRKRGLVWLPRSIMTISLTPKNWCRSHCPTIKTDKKQCLLRGMDKYR